MWDSDPPPWQLIKNPYKTESQQLFGRNSTFWLHESSEMHNKIALIILKVMITITLIELQY